MFEVLKKTGQLEESLLGEEDWWIIWGEIKDRILGGRTRMARVMTSDPLMFVLPEPEELMQHLDIFNPQITDEGMTFDCELDLPCDPASVKGRKKIPKPWHLSFTLNVKYDVPDDMAAASRMLVEDSLMFTPQIFPKRGEAPLAKQKL